MLSDSVDGGGGLMALNELPTPYGVDISPDASTNMGVNRADVKTEDAQDSLGEMQEICNILEKLKAEQIKAFTEKCGVPHYTWNRGLSIAENVRKKIAVQSIKVTK